MGAETVFSNTFAADGILPDTYGLRTVIEYRARLLTVPFVTRSNFPHSTDPVDVNAQNRSQPQPPDLEEGEAALRHLSAQIDISAIGNINPAYFAFLRCVPPLYVRYNAKAINMAQARRASETSPFNTALTFLKTFVYGGQPLRDTEHSLLSWHWADDLLAVVSGSELDRICAYNFNSNEWEISGERHNNFYAMRCVAFRPFAGRVVALGCHAGVAILSGQDMTVLSTPRHTDVISMDWSSDGQVLASAAASDGSVRLWDIATRTSTHVGKGSLVRFCPYPDSRLLFVADATAVNFRLWCCRTWKFERWGSLSGPVVAATWSADGSVLLFSTQGQSTIHVLSVGDREMGKETSIAHVEMTGLPTQGPGGTPILLEMDPTCERLAVVYEVPEADRDSERSGDLNEDRHRRFAVALYATQLRPVFEMAPVGYISGPAGSGPPVGIKFKPRPVGHAGATLTCMWRSGAVTFTHLFYTPTRS